MTEGYMALCVSILKGVPPEKAFALLAGKPGRKFGISGKHARALAMHHAGKAGRNEKDN